MASNIDFNYRNISMPLLKLRSSCTHRNDEKMSEGGRAHSVDM